VIGFALIALGYLTLRALPRRRVSYQFLSITPLLTARQEDEKRLRVTFEGEPVSDVSVVVVQLFNSGNQPIIESDFVEPITVAVGEGGRVLAAEVIEKVPEQLTQDVSADGTRAVMSRGLLNPGDVVTLKLVVAELRPAFVIGGRVVGVSRFRNAEISGLRAEFVKLLFVGACVDGALIGFFFLSLIPGAAEWPQAVAVVSFFGTTLGGILGGAWLTTRVIQGPRRHSRLFMEAYREREANAARGWSRHVG
jgi:hypothetical protein